MKKLVLFFVTAFATYGVWAFEVDGFQYAITNDGEVSFLGSGTRDRSSVIIPSSVTYNGEKYNVTSIGTRALNHYTISSVTIPNSITMIGVEAFNNCDNLTSVTIPYGVITIGESAFYGCSNLTSVTIPNSVTTIGESAFCACEKLASITIPNSVTVIENDAFSHCTGLASITISNSITTIGEHAFHDCNNLTSVTVPKGLDIEKENIYFIKNNIKYHVLNNNNVAVSRLDYLDMDNGIRESRYTGNIIIPTSITAGTTFTVTSIDVSAFLGSTITSVTIPNSVTEIGEAAFYNCVNLRSIISLASAPPNAYSNSFTYCKGNLYVPCESKKKYAASTGWSSFSNIMCGSTSVSEFFNATVVTIANNQILINGEAPAFVVTISGKKIANKNLKSGVYFVVVDGETVKVVVN